MNKFVAGAFVALISAGSANAATMSCTSSGTTFSLNDALAASCFSGNDTNTINASTEIFGMTGWTLADKNDDNTSGDMSITFTGGVVNDTKSGVWSISANPDMLKIMVNLKAGNDWGSFLVDTLSGDWSTSKDLSHASIYYVEVAPIPIPAGGLLLATGLAALGLRRRKS